MDFFITLLLFLCIGHCVADKVRYDNYKLYRVTPKNVQALKTLKDLQESVYSGLNFWSPVGVIGIPVDIMVPPQHMNEFENISKLFDMNGTLLIDNVQDQIDAENRPRKKDGSFGWTRYHTLDEINDWLRSLAQEFYWIVTLLEAGRSYEGRIIYGVKVSYSPDNANNSVFLESAIHAREWVTVGVVTYMLNEILRSTNETVRAMAESHDWYVFPVFNPDGYEYTHMTDRMWRKTRVPHSVLCTGADPNRNWDYYWNHGGTSNSPCTETYRGPAPFSEPSVKAMANFISTIGHQLVAYLDFHSYSQLLLIPYGHTNEHLDNYEQVYQIGLKAVEALARRYNTQYRVGTIYEIIYQASGSSADWVKGVFKTPIVYGYELRDQGRYGFLLPAEQIIPTALETFDSVITILEEYKNS